MTFTTRIEEVGERKRGPEAVYEKYFDYTKIDDYINSSSAIGAMGSQSDLKHNFKYMYHLDAKDAETNGFWI